MPRTAAELDVEVEALKTRVAKLEGELLVERQSHLRTQAEMERWGSRFFTLSTAAVAGLLGLLVTLILFIAGIKKP